MVRVLAFTFVEHDPGLLSRTTLEGERDDGKDEWPRLAFWGKPTSFVGRLRRLYLGISDRSDIVPCAIARE